MSDANYPLSVTLKAGQGYDSPWIVVYGNSPDEVQGKLEAVANGGLIEATVNAANALKAANNAAPLAPQGQEAQQQQAPQQQYQSPWGAGGQQQAPAPQQQAPQQQSRYGGEQHPEGKSCHCGKVLEKKTTQNGKGKWQCPDWRWNNGNPNGHDMEWVNSR